MRKALMTTGSFGNKDFMFLANETLLSQTGACHKVTAFQPMSDSPIDLDLKILPDWLKEPAGTNPYANYEGETPRRSSRHGGERSPSRGPKKPRRGERREENGPRAGGPRGERPRKPFPKQQEKAPAAAVTAEATPAPAIPLQVDFLPEAEAIAALLQQIKGSHRAFPLYGMGRMFLNKPERHRVRITSNAPAYPLFQIGENGPVYLNRTFAERDAFRQTRDQFYAEETTTVEPPKGNFTNVARCRISGVLLGPTNYHGYQPALRRLYDARFSRRMSFQDFLKQIEVVNTPEVVEEWKQQVTNVTTFKTTREEEAKEFKTLSEVEAHFKANYLPKVVREGKSVEVSGEASRAVQDRQIRTAVREAWEKERSFPAGIVNQIRPHFTEAGLHIWKHRKRILFVSEIRPVRFAPDSASVSEMIRNILGVIETAPRCTRADLSEKLLKPHEESPDFAKLKTSLAADLHWLIQAGHVIEFHDGTLDLPLPPKQPEKAAAAPAAAEEAAASAEAPEEVSAEATAETGEVAEEAPAEAPATEAPPSES